MNSSAISSVTYRSSSKWSMCARRLAFSAITSPQRLLTTSNWFSNFCMLFCTLHISSLYNFSVDWFCFNAVICLSICWALCCGDGFVSFNQWFAGANGTCAFSERTAQIMTKNIETNGNGGATVKMKDKRLPALIDEIWFCIAFFIMHIFHCLFSTLFNQIFSYDHDDGVGSVFGLGSLILNIDSNPRWRNDHQSFQCTRNAFLMYTLEIEYTENVPLLFARGRFSLKRWFILTRGCYTAVKCTPFFAVDLR